VAPLDGGDKTLLRSARFRFFSPMVFPAEVLVGNTGKLTLQVKGVNCNDTRA